MVIKYTTISHWAYWFLIKLAKWNAYLLYLSPFSNKVPVSKFLQHELTLKNQKNINEPKLWRNSKTATGLEETKGKDGSFLR